MSNYCFKRGISVYNNAKNQYKEDLKQFKYDVINFMLEYDIPVKIYFFGNTFGIDIRRTFDDFGKVPLKIPIEVLYAFCKEFDCEFLYTTCDGHRWIFKIEGMSDTYD